MYHIQYETATGHLKMQEFDSTNRAKLVQHLAHFQRPIRGIFEQASVITKAVRAEMSNLPRHNLSQHAKNFLASRD